ncbi:MAG: maleylpyruvate isomerase N-terminal domain-containing protein [Actinomycetota bacterium]
MTRHLDETVLQYRSGVRAVAETVATFDTEDWSRRSCGEWSASDTARHLLGVADWYHEWLDRAVQGDRSRPFDRAEIDDRAEAEVQSRRSLSGQEAIERFTHRAADYLERAVEHPDLALGFPFGRTTVGHHLALGAAEWHLHAWDLSNTGDSPHEPDRPAALFIVVGAAVADTEGGLRGRALRRLVPLAARRSPWSTMLRRSGRPTTPIAEV